MLARLHAPETGADTGRAEARPTLTGCNRTKPAEGNERQGRSKQVEKTGGYRLVMTDNGREALKPALTLLEGDRSGPSSRVRDRRLLRYVHLDRDEKRRSKTS